MLATSAVAKSPYEDATTKYFSAEGGGGSVTLSLSEWINQASSIYCGEPSILTDTRNKITVGPDVVTGDDIKAACLLLLLVVPAGTKTDIYVKILFSFFYSATFSDCRPDNAFEFNVGQRLGITTTAAVPEASTWAMMLLGFLGLGFLGYRKSSKNSDRAFRVA